MIILNFSNPDWEYRGEGGANIVIGLKKEKKILRLQKQNLLEDESKSSEQELERVQNLMLFIDNVMKRVLTEYYIEVPELVYISSEDIKKLNKAICPKRPVSRRHKTLREADTYALVFPDYCSIPPETSNDHLTGPVIAIEIKPKCGLLSPKCPSFDSTGLPDLCTFCMFQPYKRMRDNITVKTSYCPTDLFSGCQSRMRHALMSLLQCPLNNLRVFKNQRKVFPRGKNEDLENCLQDFFSDEARNKCDLLINLIIMVLLKSVSRGNSCNLPFPAKSLQTCHNSHPCTCAPSDICGDLPRGCVLHKILTLQSVDNLSICDLHALYEKIIKECDDSTNKIGTCSRCEIPLFFGARNKMPLESEEDYQSRKVWEFLVGLVAKDCSVMVVLQNCEQNLQDCGSMISLQGRFYTYSVFIADVDMKSLSTVEKHFTRAPSVVDHCIQELSRASHVKEEN